MDSLSRKGGFEPGYSTLEDWILAQAIPFSLDSTELNDAIDRAMARIGDTVRLLGFGEALHGKSDILLLRNRLFIRLVENHGFVAIAIESSFPRGRLVDQYIAGQGPDSFDDILELGFSHGFGPVMGGILNDAIAPVAIWWGGMVWALTGAVMFVMMQRKRKL